MGVRRDKTKHETIEERLKKVLNIKSYKSDQTNNKSQNDNTLLESQRFIEEIKANSKENLNVFY